MTVRLLEGERVEFIVEHGKLKKTSGFLPLGVPVNPLDKSLEFTELQEGDKVFYTSKGWRSERASESGKLPQVK